MWRPQRPSPEEGLDDRLVQHARKVLRCGRRDVPHARSYRLFGSAPGLVADRGSKVVGRAEIAIVVTRAEGDGAAPPRSGGELLSWSNKGIESHWQELQKKTPQGP